MSTQQQQPAPGVLPSLADLDTPAPTPSQQQPPVPPAPPAPPPEPRQVEIPKPGEQKPTEVPKPGEEKPKSESEEDTTDDVTDDTTDDNEDPQAFYNEVAKLRGDNFQFSFPDGVDPSSPEGLHHAIKSVVEHELDVFEENLFRNDSRAYAYMVHRNNGGSDEEFFRTKTEVLPEWETLKNSVDLQQQFYKRALLRKEIDPEDVNDIIKKAIEKNKLSALVETEYNKQKKLEEDQAREILRINKENQDRQEQLTNKMAMTLQDKILHNKGIGFTIPDAKRGEFLQFMNQMMHLDPRTGQWFVQQEINGDNFNHLLEAMYYLKVGGNLDEIIKNRADQHNTKRLKMSMQKDKTKKSTATDPNKTVQKPGVFPALTEL